MKKQNFFLAHKQFTLFFILALVIVGVAVFAPWVAPKDPLEAVMLDSLKAPCAEYPRGADKLGRDLLSRVIYGTRTSLVSTLILVATIFVVGTLLGIIAGYFGGWIDQVIMRIADMMISFPGMILAIAIAGMLGPSLRNGVIAITAVSWTKYARLARCMVLKVKRNLYVEAAVVNGTGTLKILWKHILVGMFQENSDEPYAEEIATVIMKRNRTKNYVETTTQMKDAIEEALAFVPEKDRKEAVKKSCQRCFQALRIDVNSEFEVLYDFLDKLPDALRPGGKVAILTFHSGEDRLVKRAFKAGAKAGVYSEVSKDVIRPSAEEYERQVTPMQSRTLTTCSRSYQMKFPTFHSVWNK